MVQIGQLDQRVTIQRIERTSDGGGGYEEQYVDVAKVWAQVSPLNGEERLTAQQTEGAVDYRITIRNRAELDGQISFVWRGKRLNATYVADAGSRPTFVTIDAHTEGPI